MIATLTWKDITSGSFGSFSIQYLFKYKNEMYLLGQKTTWSLWKYDDRNNTWLYLPSRSSVSPPLLNYTSFVAAQEENKVFILGGGTQISSKFVPSRYLFAYDFESFSWIQLNSIYFPLASVYGTYDSPAIYRSLTRYIYVFSPKEIYMYHVTSDLWYTVSYDEFPSLSYLSSHSVSFMEPFAIFSGGQLAPFQSYGASRACLNKLIFIVDLDCWTMTTVSQGDPRSGHSTILRDRQLWIFGGYRGFALNDFFSTPALTFPPTKESCRVETRCLHHNDCDDCLLIPGCGWCQDACSYGCTNRVCPSRQTLNLSEIYNGVLSGFSFMNFKIFINDPNQDIYFYFSGTKTLNLSILNLPPKFSFNATGPLAMFSYMDSRRFGGWYVLQLSNPYPESVDFQFVVSLQVPTILPNNFDLNPYLSLGFGALSLLLSACLIMKRYRDNVHRRTSCTNSQAKPMTPMYTTHLVQLRSNSSKSGSSSPTSPLIPQKKGFIPISAQLQTPLVYVSYLICMPPSDSRVLKLMVATGTFLVSPSSLPKDKKTKIRSKKKKS
ncbi:hypothetical protein HMI55_007404 [Coelomomyces lativittatus]|nr:hypothetical protein HMI55_007404 [Coelomomyces lativittatus]